MASSNSSEDVKMLFRRFGGEASTYQEVVRERNAEASRVKWPMLNSVEPIQALNAPSVHQTVRTSRVRHAVEEPQPQFQAPPQVPPAPPLAPARYGAPPVAPPAVATAPTGPLRRLGASHPAEAPGKPLREIPARVAPVAQAAPAKPVSPPPREAATGLAGRWSTPAERKPAPSAPPAPATNSLGSLFDRIAATSTPTAVPASKSLFRDRLK